MGKAESFLYNAMQMKKKAREEKTRGEERSWIDRHRIDIS